MHKEAKTIGDRLKQFGEKYTTLSDYAEALGMSYENLYQYLSGKAKPGFKIQERLRALGCDIEWLMTGKTNDGRQPLISMAPYLGKIIAGPDGKEYFDTSGIPDHLGIPFAPGNFFALEIESDSLINAEPIPIYPGDFCVFEYNRQPKNGDVIAVHLKNNKRLVKIARHISHDDVELCSANKFRNYPAVRIKKSEIAGFGILVTRMQLTDDAKRRLGFLK
jgi:SOS-response transcriptional repressor LexA